MSVCDGRCIRLLTSSTFNRKIALSLRNNAFINVQLSIFHTLNATNNNTYIVVQNICSDFLFMSPTVYIIKYHFKNLLCTDTQGD